MLTSPSLPLPPPPPPAHRQPCRRHRAYYYYLTEQGKNYEQTMLDIAAYAAQESIPYRWLLLDRYAPRICVACALCVSALV